MNAGLHYLARAGRRTARFAPPAFSIGLFILFALPAAASSAATPPILEQTRGDLPRLSAGAAFVERLGPVILDGVGPYVSARGGDWRLGNEHLALVFAAVEDDWPATRSMPLAGHREDFYPDLRKPGGLIDVVYHGNLLDYTAYFTQGTVETQSVDVVEYDTIEPVQGEGRVGLRVAGYPFDNALLRLETTYWLAEGEQRVAIESRLSGLQPGAPIPALCDAARWFVGLTIDVGRAAVLPHKNSNLGGSYLAVYGGHDTMALVPTTGTLSGRFSSHEGLHLVKLIPPIETAPDADESGTSAVELPTRELWFADGRFTALHNRYVAERAAESGRLVGRIDVPNARFATPMGTRPPVVSVYRVEPKSTVKFSPPSARGKMVELLGEIRGLPTLVSLVSADERGDYAIDLETGYYVVIPGETYSPKVSVSDIVQIKPGESAREDYALPPASSVHLSAIDAATSEPVAVRLSFEPIPPAPQVSFGLGESSLAYFNFCYIPPGGERFDLPPGKYVVKALHGPRYATLDQLIEVQADQATSYTLAVEKVIPTTGWVSVDMGARTTGTTGCLITPEDYVVLAAAEGLDWIVSGDYETLTDFAPVIDRLGLKDRIRSSVGFRTLLPAHPEWGHLFVFPISKDHPDPAVAREQWANAQTSSDWIAALRRRYPGALIQVDTPITEGGAGYFARQPTTPYIASWEPPDDADLSFDAVNVMPSRGSGTIQEIIAFWCNNMARGRFYIPSTAPLSRMLFGGEPGYPRLLVRMSGGEVDLSAVAEADLFQAMRDMRTQLTNGPFLEFAVGDALPGDTIPYDGNQPVRVRVMSPDWAPVATVIYDKEGKSQTSRVVSLQDNEYQRFPVPEAGVKFDERTIESLNLARDKDTLLGLRAIGMKPKTVSPPLYAPPVNNVPMTIISPIIVDRNGNDCFDPMKVYGDIGR
jgi:hypothetical protein